MGTKGTICGTGSMCPMCGGGRDWRRPSCRVQRGRGMGTKGTICGTGSMGPMCGGVEIGVAPTAIIANRDRL